MLRQRNDGNDDDENDDDDDSDDEEWRRELDREIGLRLDWSESSWTGWLFLACAPTGLHITVHDDHDDDDDDDDCDDHRQEA